MPSKRALICGAAGFIGSHLTKRLKDEGYWVRGVDIVAPEFEASAADEFILGDLRSRELCDHITKDVQYDELYQLAADMGGAGYIFTGFNDADILHNSAMINLNMVEMAKNNGVKKVFYSSSACIYPIHNQLAPDNPGLPESCAYPAAPDSEYGWEKLFSERLYLTYGRNYGMEIRIGRLHNVFGPLGVWKGGKEKAPAAICRKVAEAADNGEIEIWGDGRQTRSFLYIDECLEGIRRLMISDYGKPINIGSSEMVSISDLAHMVMEIASKPLKIRYIDGPLGVRGRNSDNTLIYEKLGWRPTCSLEDGLAKTYPWIEAQVKTSASSR